MKVTRIVKNFVKPHVDAPSWVNLDLLSNSSTMLVDLFRATFWPRKPDIDQESFDVAMARLNLDEAGIQKRYQDFKKQFIIFAILSALVFLYSLYHLFNYQYKSGLLCFIFCLLLLSQTFRFSFWMFQIKQRRLGCTFKEWWNGVMN